MIDLFRHNKEAYEAAVRMLAERGKAAVIHPTGTGKSFIGFKLCEDNPEKTICWLSPSRYIYQTQLENIREVSDDYTPDNVKFYTYAKLMLMSEEEIAEIQPDYIILDEYHRVGAEQWGLGVDNVLKMYPDAPVLGLSATAIRYLDNQRNMTEELLDGNIASEMTLGEAIVRNILAPPKYILSIFSYQKDLERYEKRAATAKSKAVQDAADKYLDALRRALDKAEKASNKETLAAKVFVDNRDIPSNGGLRDFGNLGAVTANSAYVCFGFSPAHAIALESDVCSHRSRIERDRAQLRHEATQDTAHVDFVRAICSN
jgi:superfamily II DNA or RNA helicase